MRAHSDAACSLNKTVGCLWQSKDTDKTQSVRFIVYKNQFISDIFLLCTWRCITLAEINRCCFLSSHRDATLMFTP
jgi:hypothetical protein